MYVPLCKMVPMPIVRPTLEIDILKFEPAFHMGYKEGDKVFYLSLTNQQGEEEDVTLYNNTWDEHQLLENDLFEKVIQTLRASPTKCCLYGMGTPTSKPGYLTLTNCIVMIHLGTYLLI